ncbi:MAG: c-type cytochrome [Chloroflexota bacterium]
MQPLPTARIARIRSPHPGARQRAGVLLGILALAPLLSGCLERGAAGNLTWPIPPSNQPMYVSPADVPGGSVDRGRRVLAAYGCGACHVIPGVPGGVGAVGPPLTGWAQRAYIAGALPNQPTYLIAWLRNPQDVEPGTAMPNLGVTEVDARDMAAYLYSIR